MGSVNRPPRGLHRKPNISEQQIVIVSEYCVSIKLIVVRVLETYAHISPRPDGCAAGNKGGVGYLEDVAVGVWATSTSRISAKKYRI